ncbi:MAG: DinB family protein [Planctomycetota bacterium]
MNPPKCTSIDLIADELIEVVDFFAARLVLIDEMSARHKPSEERWCIQEVVGHLVDSATNNHQRFIRALTSDVLDFPGYEQNSWVKSQRYGDGSWNNLIQLWKTYNFHLAHVIRQIPDHKMRVKCTVGNNEPVSLSFLIEDYLTHLKHHLNKINERTGI